MYGIVNFPCNFNVTTCWVSIPRQRVRWTDLVPRVQDSVRRFWVGFYIKIGSQLYSVADQWSTPAVRCLRPLQLPGKISSLILLLLQNELKSVAQLVAMMNRSLFQFLFNRQYFIGIFSGFFLAAALIYVPVLNCNQDDCSINGTWTSN